MNELEDELESSFDENIVNYSNSVLCDLIVVSRYLNFNQEAAVLAMKELSKRRESGSDFDFESSIEEKLKELPTIPSNMMDIKSIFSSII